MYHSGLLTSINKGSKDPYLENPRENPEVNDLLMLSFSPPSKAGPYYRESLKYLDTPTVSVFVTVACIKAEPTWVVIFFWCCAFCSYLYSVVSTTMFRVAIQNCDLDIGSDRLSWNTVTLKKPARGGILLTCSIYLKLSPVHDLEMKLVPVLSACLPFYFFCTKSTWPHWNGFNLRGNFACCSFMI